MLVGDMRTEPFLGFLLFGAVLTVFAPVAPAQGADCVRISQRSAFARHGPLPQELKQLTSDETSGCRGNPGNCHGYSKDDKSCGTVVSSERTRFCGCTNPP